ncbi:MAG TPA: AfsR/SARP family transcriptional regulator [Gaiellaceae bacterium]|jgi:DNA-binding SARP family transcriptional activator|nr:AfsR/SARP family transcriptional regulator [Gaiellaceae bacterium]
MDEFRLLGPLEAFVQGEPIRLAAPKPRALLALLLLNRNRVVPTERLVDELWGDDPPARATKTLQVYVSQLRKALGPERLVTRPPGYELRVEEGELDVERFESLAAAAREQLSLGNARAAVGGLKEALALWRGPALREFRSEPFGEPAAARLEELRLDAVEDRLQAELDAGAAAAVVPELEELVAAEPFRERPRALLMLALYRSDRQADALELYRRTRELFVDELGIEPGPVLQELERAILRQDTDLRLPAPPPPAREVPPLPPRRRRLLLALATLGAALVVAVSVAALVRSGGGHHTPQGSSQLRVFVHRLEGFLDQSRTGREGVKSAIDGAVRCRFSPAVATAKLDTVQRNRQSLLDQIAALHVPPGEEALRASDLLQKATAASIAADFVYRDWLRPKTSCSSLGRPPAAARAADARATRLKRQFLVAFDPLAKRFGQRVWKADEF